MILPLWGQSCIVDYRGEQVLAQARSPHINHDGTYYINVYSQKWGYDLLFTPDAIELLPVVLANGEKYDARLAYSKKYNKLAIAVAVAVAPRRWTAQETANIRAQSGHFVEGVVPEPKLQSVANTPTRVTRTIRKHHG